MNVSSLLPQALDLAGSIDWLAVLKTGLFFAVVFFAAGAILRLFFGEDSNTIRAVSACLSILLVYMAAILVYLFLPELRSQLQPLPFITVNEQIFSLWDLSELSQELLFGSILRMALLAFLVNLLETFLPKGEGFFGWYLWRSVTVLVSLAAYCFVCGLIQEYLPELFTTWAMPLILGFWALIILSGLLKLLLSVILTVVNPIIGGLYIFFFSNLFGRQFSKSILTTVILLVLVECLNGLGFSQFAFSDFSLAAYGPACLIIFLTLYLFGKFL